MKILKEAKWIIDKLKQAGFEAFAVGGCMRDIIMGNEPDDWDITTSATPDQVKALFEHVIETGIKHGTVTVLVDGKPFEVTTFRSEGAYSDGRHPDEVIFSQHITDDLSRRDFTMNAIAYDETELVDEFGGVEDIKNRVIKCVGDPYKRFEEDALRILRAIRFSATLGFEIDTTSRAAMLHHKDRLKMISVERIYKEFAKLLQGENVEAALRDNADILAVVLPEIVDMMSCDQNHPCHKYNVWEHTLKVVAAIGKGAEGKRLLWLRLAALFHDIGKPSTKALDEENVTHFYRHNSVSRDMARNILNRWNVDNETKDYVCMLVKYHDMVLENSDVLLKKWMNRLTPQGLIDLIELNIADTKGQADNVQYRIKEHRLKQARVVELLEEKACFSLKDLAVNGSDLIGIGFVPGSAIGETLKWILEEVVEGRLENRKEVLLEAARERLER